MATQGFGGTAGGRPQLDQAALLRVVQIRNQHRRRKGGPAGGRPNLTPQLGTTPGKPVLSAARSRRRRITEDSIFWQPGRMGNRRGRAFPDYVQGLRSR